MAEDGILIIEDIQHFSFIDILIKCVPNDFQKYIQIYDLRQIKNCRYDDVLFVINKTIYTGEDLKPHPYGVLEFKLLPASYLKNESAVRI